MRVIIEEYGKIILMIIIGSFVLGILVAGIRICYQYTYPDIDIASGINTEYVAVEPIIIAERIEIEKCDDGCEIDFSNYIKAYEDSSMEQEIGITVIGGDDIDISEVGFYQIVCTATNENGYSFSKRIPVLIY